MIPQLKYLKTDAALQVLTIANNSKHQRYPRIRKPRYLTVKNKQQAAS